jgi:hypothetical protein
MAVPQFATAFANALATGGIPAALAVMDDAVKLVGLSAEAATYAEADTNLGTGSGKKILEFTVTAGDFSQSGTGFATKISFGGKTGGTVTVAGPANPAVLAFLRASDSTILCQLTETGSTSFSSGGSPQIAAFDIFSFGTLA